MTDKSTEKLSRRRRRLTHRSSARFNKFNVVTVAISATMVAGGRICYRREMERRCATSKSDREREKGSHNTPSPGPRSGKWCALMATDRGGGWTSTAGFSVNQPVTEGKTRKTAESLSISSPYATPTDAIPFLVSRSSPSRFRRNFFLLLLRFTGHHSTGVAVRNVLTVSTCSGRSSWTGPLSNYPIWPATPFLSNPISDWHLSWLPWPVVTINGVFCGGLRPKFYVLSL